jgi:hypothetical protein
VARTALRVSDNLQAIKYPLDLSVRSSSKLIEVKQHLVGKYGRADLSLIVGETAMPNLLV